MQSIQNSKADGKFYEFSLQKFRVLNSGLKFYGKLGFHHILTSYVGRTYITMEIFYIQALMATSEVECKCERNFRCAALTKNFFFCFCCKIINFYFIFGRVGKKLVGRDFGVCFVLEINICSIN